MIFPKPTTVLRIQNFFISSDSNCIIISIQNTQEQSTALVSNVQPITPTINSLASEELKKVWNYLLAELRYN